MAGASTVATVVEGNDMVQIDGDCGVIAGDGLVQAPNARSALPRL